MFPLEEIKELITEVTELVEPVLQEEQLERIQGGSTLQGDQPVLCPGVLGVGGLSADPSGIRHPHKGLSLYGALTMSSKKLRNLYFMIIVWSAPANPRELFDQFLIDWADDFRKRAQRKEVVFMDDQLRTMVLLDLKNQLFNVVRQLTDYGLHELTEQELATVSVLTGGMSSVIIEEMDFNVEQLTEEAQEIFTMYTEEQQAVHNRILDAINNDTRLALYINAKGVCGKTFLLNGILKAVRSLEGVWPLLWRLQEFQQCC